ncbi:hypothetical protein PMAC_002983 [Pneumocystis sp. 'macacae']|nr:hypothetical protein PMAC_002983 [Pneumocystis sp. 'macacae']
MKFNKLLYRKLYIRISKCWTHNNIYKALDSLEKRHLGVNGPKEEKHLLKQLGLNDIDTFIKKTIPNNVLITDKKIENTLDKGLSESELLFRLHKYASKNSLIKSLIGMGYVGTNIPTVIQRNILENPAWYTSYTPYQPEISQGRLECLINYQTMISDLTELPISNASLLDESTAAGEAMVMAFSILNQKRKTFYVDINAHPQTIAVLELRSSGFGINIVVGEPTKDNIEPLKNDIFGILLQYPDTFGGIRDYTSFSQYIHSLNAQIICATDLLALTLLQSPSQWGADIIIGSSQRFGIPMGFGGPHAAFIACKDVYKRKIPGRIVGITKDRNGKLAYRLALQTREQHIRREKATSNICTSQVLLANMASLYAVYHGPIGLRNIAEKILSLTKILGEFVIQQGHSLYSDIYFDTITIKLKNRNADQLLKKALSKGYNLRPIDKETIGITLDETVTEDDMKCLFEFFSKSNNIETPISISEKLNISLNSPATFPEKFQRKTAFLQQKVFNSYHTETEILRYIHYLQSKDISLVYSMIPLGSCTMKLNATTEMLSVTWPEFNSLHPFVPSDQAKGYHMLIKDLENDLLLITGFDACTFQPNSGASGEYTGLQIISKYHRENKQGHRNICLIPVSAHGTNPASAAMAGMKVVPIKCDSNGNIQLDDLKMKADLHKNNLAAFMVTYPSTHGVFEPHIVEALKIVHDFGGQVYFDGANMNAQIGLCSPAKIGADICHLNLHKTFCIPHGGGGPGVGVCAMKNHLSPYIPGHPVVKTGGKKAIPPVASAPWGSASILPISWAYIKMLGGKGLIHASKIALLNANYMASKLSKHYKILYTNSEGMCAHEFILDVRDFKKTSGIEAIDIAKRLQDYSFHAPTMSWPVPNTLMVEPTESESIAEMDRFCDALISIRQEIKEIEEGKQPKDNNLLFNAPHPLDDFISEEWNRPYSKEKAAYPLEYLRKRKFWPSTARINDTWGDLNFFCSCEPSNDFLNT